MTVEILAEVVCTYVGGEVLGDMADDRLSFT